MQTFKLNISIWLGLLLIIAVLPNFNLDLKLSAGYGLLISFLIKMIFNFFFNKQKKKLTASAGYSLFLLANIFFTRFIFVIFMFFLGIKVLNFEPKLLLTGFVIGQLIFIFEKTIMVTKNNVS